MSTKTVTCNFTQRYICLDDYAFPDDSGVWSIPDAHYTIGSVTRSSTAEPAYCVAYFRFTTPYFEGTCKNILINLATHGTFSAVPMRYAICKSYANRDLYRNTTLTVSDENQVTSGILSVTSQAYEYAEGETTAIGLTKTELLIDTTKLEPNTTYYLFLWAGGVGYGGAYQIGMHANHLSRHTAIVTYYENVTHIDNGSELKAHKCYIDTGDDWIPIIPYIDNGSSWSPCV